MKKWNAGNLQPKEETTNEISPPQLRHRVYRKLGVCVDGYPFIFISGLLTFAAFRFLGAWYGYPMMVVSLWVISFFRDPERQIPTDPDAIVSSADGTILDVKRVPYPRLLEGEATRVSIFMSIFNVHVNRIPFSGTVRNVDYNHGLYLSAYKEKASLDNEQMAVVVDTDRNVPILFVQIAGAVARRIVCRLSPGERVEKGERFGLIRFGSRMDLYFTDHVEVQVKPGQKVQAGKTILAKFVSK